VLIDAWLSSFISPNVPDLFLYCGIIHLARNNRLINIKFTYMEGHIESNLALEAQKEKYIDDAKMKIYNNKELIKDILKKYPNDDDRQVFDAVKEAITRQLKEDSHLEDQYPKPADDVVENEYGHAVEHGMLREASSSSKDKFVDFTRRLRADYH